MPGLYNCILNSEGNVSYLVCSYCLRAQHQTAHSKVKIFCTGKSIVLQWLPEQKSLQVMKILILISWTLLLRELPLLAPLKICTVFKKEVIYTIVSLFHSSVQSVSLSLGLKVRDRWWQAWLEQPWEPQATWSGEDREVWALWQHSGWRPQFSQKYPGDSRTLPLRNTVLTAWHLIGQPSTV